jgi:hypothetical protein
MVALWLAVLADMGTSIAVTLNGLQLFRRGRDYPRWDTVCLYAQNCREGYPLGSLEITNPDTSGQSRKATAQEKAMLERVRVGL